jgi:hypothetical protein
VLAFEELPGRAAKPIELRHHDHVAGPQRGHELGELRPIGASTADFLFVDHASAGGLQRASIWQVRS